MPLVMLVIGTSYTGTPDHTSFQSTAADVAVQFADAIGVAAHPQRQDGHAEWIVRRDPRLSEGEEFVERDVQLLRKLAEIFLHHVPRERVVTRRDRSMCGKNIGRGDDLQRGIKIELLFCD